MLVYTGFNASSTLFSKDQKEFVITDGFLELPCDFTGLEIQWNYFVIWKGNDLYISGNFEAGNDMRRLVIPGEEKLNFVQAVADTEVVTLITSDKKIWRYEVYNDIWKAVDNFIPTNDDHLQEFVVNIDKHSSIVALTNLGRIFNVPNLIDMPKRIKFVDIACGFNHLILLADNGDVYSMGMGTRGQLGHGDLEDYDGPVLVEALAGLKINQIAAGGWHNAALTNNGDLYTWGWNIFGELGIITNPKVVPMPTVVELTNKDGTNCDDSIIKVQCGNAFTMCLSVKGKIYGCGCNKYSQLGEKSKNVESLQNFVEIKTNFTRKITDIKCNQWGTLITLAEE